MYYWQQINVVCLDLFLFKFARGNTGIISYRVFLNYKGLILISEKACYLHVFIPIHSVSMQTQAVFMKVRSDRAKTWHVII